MLIELSVFLNLVGNTIQKALCSEHDVLGVPNLQEREKNALKVSWIFTNILYKNIISVNYQCR